MDGAPKHRIPLGVLYAGYLLLLTWALFYRIPYTIDILRLVRDPLAVAASPFEAAWPSQRIYDLPNDNASATRPPLERNDRVVSIDGKR